MTAAMAKGRQAMPIRRPSQRSARTFLVHVFGRGLSGIFFFAASPSTAFSNAASPDTCQSAFKVDPESACNIDPPGSWMEVVPVVHRGVPVDPPGQPGRGPGRRRVTNGA